MLKLNSSEKQWSETYQKSLDESYPGLVERVILFGSKARGDFHPDSDLDLVLIIRDGDWKLKKEVRYLGYDPAMKYGVLPSIIVYTHQEFQERKDKGAAFIEVLEDEGITVQ